MFRKAVHSDIDAIFENRWRRVRVLDSDTTVNRREVTLKLVHEYWKTNQADFGHPLKLEERFRLDLGDVRLEGEAELTGLEGGLLLSTAPGEGHVVL